MNVWRTDGINLFWDSHLFYQVFWKIRDRFARYAAPHVWALVSIHSEHKVATISLSPGSRNAETALTH